MKKRLCVSLWVGVSVLSVMAITGCAPPEKSVAVFTDSGGRKAAEFGVAETVYGSFSRLKPNTQHDIRILRSDGREISHSSFISDERGIIPTSPLWWDVGVEYGKSRFGKLNVDELLGHRYTCQIRRGKKSVAKYPIRIRPPSKNSPTIYSSDARGNVGNGFVHGKESVYVTGRDFPPGCGLRIHVVPDQYTWEAGDPLRAVRGRPLVLQLDKDQTYFTTLVWSSGQSAVGSYDIIVEYETANGALDHADLVDSRYSVGFTIFALPGPGPGPPPSHIEEQLACQAPPHDPVTGVVIGAPNPIYKDIFAVVEEVWVAVNPMAGGGYYAGQTARLYVLNDKPASGWTDGTSLSDVSGGYETVVIQPGCANVNYHRVWATPGIGDYDVIVDFAPFGQYDVGNDIIDSCDKKGFYVPTLWVCLESISFDHTPNSSSSDGLNIRVDRNEDVVVPEWQKAKKPYSAAYIKNNPVTIKAVFSAAPGVANCKINASVVYGLLGAVTQKTVYFNNSGSSGSVEFNLASGSPNEIRSSSQKWKWYFEDMNGSSSLAEHFASSINKIFVVLAQPPSPWTTSGQSEPWEKVLQRSCWWANGKTTQEAAAEQVQHHLYYDLGGSYDYGPQYTSKTTGVFRMTNFLGNMSSIGVVNCYDMGKSLVSFSNVLGCNLSYKLSDPFGSLNCEKAIGKPWKCTERFSNHGFGNIGNNVFDACLKIDSDSNPNSGPPYTETWLTDVPWSTYNTMVVENETANTPIPYNFGVE